MPRAKIELDLASTAGALSTALEKPWRTSRRKKFGPADLVLFTWKGYPRWPGIVVKLSKELQLQGSTVGQKKGTRQRFCECVAELSPTGDS